MWELLGTAPTTQVDRRNRSNTTKGSSYAPRALRALRTTAQRRSPHKPVPIDVQWVGFGRGARHSRLNSPREPTWGLTRRCKTNNQVTHFRRPVERQKMPATLERRHFGALYQRAVVLAF